ncbi:MAG: efflux RND transporter permease subunit [bacterium]
MGLSEFAVKRPIAILMVFVGLIVIGGISLTRLSVELMPNASYGIVTIKINVRGGMPPEDIESLVTRPVEEAVSPVKHLNHIISTSKKESSTVMLTFEPGTNMKFAALEVREKIGQIRNKLPEEIEKPVIERYDEADFPITILALTGTGYTPEMLRKIAEERMKEQLSRINGIANVEVRGGRERKILVEIDQGRLQAYNLPIKKVIGILNLSNLNLLTGSIDKRKYRYLVRTMGEFRNVEEIKKLGIIVTPGGSIIRLEDIADVKDSYLEPEAYARLNTRPVTALYIHKESTANTVRISEAIKKELKKIKPNLPGEVNIVTVSDQAVFIKQSIKTVWKSLLFGAFLAGAILFLFLKDIKHIFVIVTVIPISVMVAFSLMYFRKITLNVMTLSGLALGIGMLLDNSIVVLENIFKHKTKVARGDDQSIQQGIDSQTSQKEVSVKASREVILPIVAGTITTLVVFLPIVFINKQVEILYSGLALTVTFSLIASLFVALTLVPLLSSRIPLYPVGKAPLGKGPVIKAGLRKFFGLLGKRDDRENYGDDAGNYGDDGVEPEAPSEFSYGVYGESKQELRSEEDLPSPQSRKRKLTFNFPKLHNLYEKTLAFILRKRYIAIAGLVFLFLLSLLIYRSFLEKDYMGTTEQSEFTIFVELPSGAKLEISDQVVSEVESMLTTIPEIKEVTKTVTARVEGWSSKVYVTLLPRSERARTVQEVIDTLRPRVRQIGEVYDTFIYFSEPQSASEVFLDVYGYDYNVLRDLAISLGKSMGTVAGLADVKLRYKPGRPEMRFNVDKQRSAYFGLSVRDIAEITHAQMRGLRATYFHDKARQVETIARLDERHRRDFEDLRKLTLDTPSGAQIYLEQIVDFNFALSPSEIWRKDKNRMIQVSAHRGRLTLGTAVERIKKSIANIKPPKDYYYEFSGDYQEMVQNEKEFKFALCIMVILVFIVLASLFESYSQPLIIMVTVPMAVIGAILALFITHKPVTMGVFIGLIMLGGIAVNNAIILVDRINHLRGKEEDALVGNNLNGGKILRREPLKAVLQAGGDRLRPILMTSLTTILGLLPMALDRSEGSSLWSPLAITVIGGLAASTILTLFIVPAFYMIFEDVKKIIRLANET